MGGAAFASGPHALYTPRMPPAVYQAALARTHAVLRTLFVAVATPIEGPSKADFGDIDVLAAWPKDETQSVRQLLETAASRLGAVRAIYEGPNKATLALVWPGAGEIREADAPEEQRRRTDESPRETGEKTQELRDSGNEPGENESAIRKCDTPNTMDTDTTPKTPYIQLDLNIAPSLRSFQWDLFLHAHGDLWNMIGSLIRPLGLTVDDSALWLRIPEIEKAHRNRAKVFLTDEPVEVLHFLGLRVLDHPGTGVDTGADTGADTGTINIWEQPFADTWTLFDYVASCRFFLLFPDDEPTAAHRKANDRRRLTYRPLYRQWDTEYMPALRALNRYPVASRTADPARNIGSLSDHRDRVREAAFARFPGTAHRYAATLTAWVRERHAQDIWTAAKAAVPSDLPSQFRGEVCAAVRRQLGLERNAADGNRALEEAAQGWTVEAVTAFVKANWEELGRARVSGEMYAHYVEWRKGKEEEREEETKNETKEDEAVQGKT